MTWTVPNFTQFSDLMTYPNTASSGVFGYMVLIALWLVIFLSLKSYRTEAAALTASIITLTVGVMFVAVGFVNVAAIPFLVVMVLISFGARMFMG
jgi:hypothetical protein